MHVVVVRVCRPGLSQCPFSYSSSRAVGSMGKKFVAMQGLEDLQESSEGAQNQLMTLCGLPTKIINPF